MGAAPAGQDVGYAAGSEQDKAKRQKIYCEIAHKIATDLPLLYLVQNSYYVIAKLEVVGDMGLFAGLVDVRNLSLAR